MFDEVGGSALGQLSRVLKDRNVELALPPTLPLLSFDAVLIERLLCNLLDNAIKYSSPASLIRIAAVPMGQDVRVSVDDRGAGVPAGLEDRKSTRLNPVTNAQLVCRLLLEKKK